MGLLSGILGSKGGFSGQDRRRGNDLYEQMGDIGDWFDPMQENAFQMEGFDDALRGQQSAFGGNLLSKGFRGLGSFGLGRARFGAQTRANTRQKGRDWRLKGLQMQAGFLPQLAQMNYRQGSSGILPGLASLAGGFLGGGKGLGNVNPMIDESGAMGGNDFGLGLDSPLSNDWLEQWRRQQGGV